MSMAASTTGRSLLRPTGGVLSDALGANRVEAFVAELGMLSGIAWADLPNSGFVWLRTHSRITTSQDSLKLIRCESLKTAWNAGVILN